MRIYMDAVIVLNFAVDLLLIFGTNQLTGHPSDIRNVAAASAAGGLYGGICMIPELAFLGNMVWRIIFLGVIGGIAFGWSIGSIRRTGVFTLLCFALGGVSTGMRSRHFVTLVLAAWGIRLVCRVCFPRGVSLQEYIPVVLSRNGKKMNLLALKDTGNNLRDPITGEQVYVLGSDAVQKLTGLTEEQLQNPIKTIASSTVSGLRLIPYHGVGQPGGLMLAMRFENAWIGGNQLDPLVAFAPGILAKGENYQMLTGGTV